MNRCSKAHLCFFLNSFSENLISPTIASLAINKVFQYIKMQKNDLNSTVFYFLKEENRREKYDDWWSFFACCAGL